MVKAVWNGVVIAESDDTVVVDGDHYFPEASLNRQYVTFSNHRSGSTWKGQAHYYSLLVNGEMNPDAVWYYPRAQRGGKGDQGAGGVLEGRENHRVTQAEGAMPVIVDQLGRHPQHVGFVAGLVWREFWADVQDGMTEAELAAAFGGQAPPGRVLASLIAQEGHTPLGCVHLIDTDDESLSELDPWLAAMVVVPQRRGQGIGSAGARTGRAGEKTCQDVLVVKDDKSATTEYYVTKNAVAEKFGHVCSGETAATVTGVVSEKDGKKWIEPSKMEKKG